jgi:hypothetical protein
MKRAAIRLCRTASHPTTGGDSPGCSGSGSGPSSSSDSGATDLSALVAVHLPGPFQCWSRLSVCGAKTVPATQVAIQIWVLWFSLLRRRCREIFCADRGTGLLGQPVQDQVPGPEVRGRRGQRRRSTNSLPQDLRHGHGSACPESWRPAESLEHAGHGVSPGLRNVSSLEDDDDDDARRKTESESEK